VTNLKDEPNVDYADAAADITTRC